jgi:hypothetical protein
VNDEAAALVAGVETKPDHEVAWFNFKMEMIRLAAVLGQAHGRAFLLLLIAGIARLACPAPAVASWFIALQIIQGIIRCLRDAHKHSNGDSPPGFWFACILVLVDACFVFSTWWYIFRSSIVVASEDKESHQKAVVYAGVFVGVAVYNATWNLFALPLLKLCGAGAAIARCRDRLRG